MPVTIDDSSAVTSPGEETIPLAFDRDDFLAVPEARRPEAIKRASFLIMRGETPGNALRRAQSGMMDDESERDRPVDWEIVAYLCDTWRYPSRDTNGRPKKGLLDACEILHGMIEAADDGEILEYREAVKRLSQWFVGQESLDKAVGLYQHFTGIKSPRQIAQEQEESLQFESDETMAGLDDDQIPWAVEDDPGGDDYPL